MSEEIPVHAIVAEKTYVGKVWFPVTVPEGLADLIRIPDDMLETAEEMGLDQQSVKFLLAVLRGKWGLRAELDLQDLAIKIGMKYPDMDRIVRDLLDKNYATLGEKLEVFRYWVVLLHVKGIVFTGEKH